MSIKRRHCRNIDVASLVIRTNTTFPTIRIKKTGLDRTIFGFEGPRILGITYTKSRPSISSNSIHEPLIFRSMSMVSFKSLLSKDSQLLSQSTTCGYRPWQVVICKPNFPVGETELLVQFSKTGAELNRVWKFI